MTTYLLDTQQYYSLVRPTPVATGSDSSHGNMGTSVDDTSRGGMYAVSLKFLVNAQF